MTTPTTIAVTVQTGPRGPAGTGAAWGALTGPITSQADLVAYVAAQITALVNGAPGALDTLKELADAINDDASFAATITSALALKAPLAAPTFTGHVTVPTPTNGTDAANKTYTDGKVPLTTKGDLFGFDTAGNRLPVGANGQVLTADSTQALGVKWAAAQAALNTRRVSGNVTAANGDYIEVDASGGAVAVTGPAGNTAGVQYHVIKTDSSANAVTITAASGQIDGAANVTLAAQYQQKTFTQDGTTTVSAVPLTAPVTSVNGLTGAVTISGSVNDRGWWAATTVYAAGDGVSAPAAGPTYAAGDPIVPISTPLTSRSSFDTTEAALWKKSGTMTPTSMKPRRIAVLEGQQVWDFGHSYFASGGAGSWPILFNGRHNTSGLTARGSAGATAGQTATQVQTQLASLGLNGSAGASLRGLMLIQALINDSNGSVPVATVVEAYRSIFAQLSCVRVGIAQSAFAYSANWTSGVTSTTGAYFDYGFRGDTSYLLLGFTSGAAVNLTISHSGTGGATWSSPNVGGYSYAFPGAIKLSGFGAGYHTVRVTLTSGAGLTVYSGHQPNPSPPTIVHCAEGALPSPYTGAQNTLLTATYPQGIAAILPDFPNAVQVAADAGWDNTQMIFPDNVHLNDRGLVYWSDLVSANLARVLDYRDGLDNMTTTQAAAYTPLPTAGYTASTVNTSTNYVNLTMHASNAAWVTPASPDPVFPAGVVIGSGLIITGGAGWTAGLYKVANIVGGTFVLDSAPAGLGVAGGAGNLTM